MVLNALCDKWFAVTAMQVVHAVYHTVSVHCYSVYKLMRLLTSLLPNTFSAPPPAPLLPALPPKGPSTLATLFNHRWPRFCGGPEHTRATCGGDMYVMYANALSVAGTSYSLSHT